MRIWKCFEVLRLLSPAVDLFRNSKTLAMCLQSFKVCLEYLLWPQSYGNTFVVQIRISRISRLLATLRLITYTARAEKFAMHYATTQSITQKSFLCRNLWARKVVDENAHFADILLVQSSSWGGLLMRCMFVLKLAQNLKFWLHLLSGHLWHTRVWTINAAF